MCTVSSFAAFEVVQNITKHVRPGFSLPTPLFPQAGCFQFTNTWTTTTRDRKYRPLVGFLVIKWQQKTKHKSFLTSFYLYLFTDLLRIGEIFICSKIQYLLLFFTDEKYQNDKYMHASCWNIHPLQTFAHFPLNGICVCSWRWSIASSQAIRWEMDTSVTNYSVKYPRRKLPLWET